MTAECGEQVQTVGDDLFVTNPMVRHIYLPLTFKHFFLSNFDPLFTFIEWFQIVYTELRRQLMRRHAMLFLWYIVTLFLVIVGLM